MSSSIVALERIAAQRSDARELLGPAATAVHDLQTGFEAAVARGSKMVWAGAVTAAQALQITGERARKHRTGISVTTAALAGGTAIVSAVLAARNIQIYEPLKGTVEVFAEQPVSPMTTTGDVVNSMAVSGVSATTGALATLCAFVFERGKRLGKTYATDPRLPTTPYAAVRPPVNVTSPPKVTALLESPQMSAPDFRSRERYHQARADILTREREALERRTLLTEVIATFGEVPAPTTATYRSEAYQLPFNQTQVDELRPPVLPAVAESPAPNIEAEIAALRSRFGSLVSSLEAPVATPQPASPSDQQVAAQEMGRYFQSSQPQPVAA